MAAYVVARIRVSSKGRRYKLYEAVVAGGGREMITIADGGMRTAEVWCDSGLRTMGVALID